MSESSTAARPKLGKGLEALIPKSFFASGKTIVNIPIAEIRPNPFQPRHRFDPEKLRSLSESIRLHGLHQPIVVRRKESYYELVAGERRYRACMLAKIDVIPAIIKDMSDRDSLKIALIENLERQDLNAIEEGKGYVRLIEEFGLTHQELAEMFSKSRSAVSNTLRLLKLPDEIQQAIIEGELSEGHARALLSLDNDIEMLKGFRAIQDGGMNVRQVEESSKKVSKKKDKPAQQLSLFGEIENTLTKTYDTKVKVNAGKRGGKIVIHYSNAKQLKDIFEKLKLSS